MGVESGEGERCGSDPTSQMQLRDLRLEKGSTKPRAAKFLSITQQARSRWTSRGRAPLCCLLSR